jgi:hypothetical protein
MAASSGAGDEPSEVPTVVVKGVAEASGAFGDASISEHSVTTLAASRPSADKSEARRPRSITAVTVVPIILLAGAAGLIGEKSIC